MISMLWRFFPGPGWLRVLIILAAIVALAVATVTYVYPWVALQLPDVEVTITE